MNKPAIVCLVWDIHLSAIIHYLACRPSYVLTLSYNTALISMRDELKKVGGDVVILDAQLENAILSRSQHAAEERVATWDKLLCTPAWQRLISEYQLETESLGQIIRSEIEQIFPHELVLIALLDNAANKYNIELVVTSEDWLFLQRTIVNWARSRNIPTLHIAHALPLATPYTIHSHIASYAYAVPGLRAVEACLDADMQREKIHMTGNPAWDIYFDAHKHQHQWRDELRKKYSLRDQPIILFATTWTARLTAYDYGDRSETTLRAYMQAIKTLRERRPEWNLIIKCRDSDNTDALLSRITREVGVCPEDYVAVYDPAYRWVTCASAIIAVDSNILIEAMHAKVPAINLLTEQGLLMGPSFDAQSGILEVQPEHLVDQIIAVVEDAAFRNKLIHQMDSRLSYYNIGADGKAAIRVAALMFDLAEKKSHPDPMFNEQLAKHSEKKYPWQSLGTTYGHRQPSELYSDVARKDIVTAFLHPPRRALDIGCATGATAEYLKTIYPSLWIAGVEPSPIAAEIARQRSDLVICGRFEEISLEDYGISHSSIDTVILADVLEHMYDPWGVLVRLRPYLTDDAQVLASIPNISNLWLLDQLARGRFPYEPIGLLDITHIRFFTKEEIHKLFEQTGYTIEYWDRIIDPRLHAVTLKPGSDTISTDKLIIKNVTPEELENLKTIQFLVRARPSQTVAAIDDKRNGPSKHNRALRHIAIYGREFSVSSCPQIRFLRPARHLLDAIKVSWGVEELSNDTFKPKFINADLYVITRIYPNNYTQSSIDELFDSGKPVIYDTDDLLIDLPPDNLHAQEYSQYRPYIEQLLRRAHAVTVSTFELARRLSPYNNNIHIIPNYIDFDLFYRLPKPARRQVRIGLSGTAARESDFKLVDIALRRICDEYRHRVRIFFIGAIPYDWQNHPQSEFIPFISDYRAYAARMKALDLDIGLAPLQDNEFNSCKSPVKWMEYSALGMATICSYTTAYKHVIAQGKTGLMVENQPEKWYTAIKLLIDQPEYRQLLALEAQKEVLRNYSLQRQGHRWLAAYQDIYQLLHAKRQSSARATEPNPPLTEEPNSPYDLWQLGHQLLPHERQWWEAEMHRWPSVPRFAIGMVLPADKLPLFERSLMSLQQQLLDTWELVVVSSLSPPNHLIEEPRLIWLESAENDWLASLSTALCSRVVDWVTMIEAGDALPAHALCRIAHKSLQHPDWVALYVDEDRIDATGKRVGPYFKPAFAAEWLRSAPYCLGGGLWCRAQLFRQIGGYDSNSLGFEHWHLALRLLEHADETAIGHIEDVLYHRHTEGGHCALPADTVEQAARASLNAHLTRMQISAHIEPDPLLPAQIIRYRVQGEPLVSILLPVLNRLDLLKPTLTSLVEQTDYHNGEILIVDLGSTDADVLQYFADVEALGADRLRLLRADDQRSLLARLNHAANQARGSYLLLYVPGCVVQHADWLATLLGYAQQPQVGAVGPALVDLDSGKMQLGMILGLGGDLAARVYTPSAQDHGYYGLARLPHRVSSLPGECLLTRRPYFEQFGGFDESLPTLSLAVTDYCLRLAERGYKILCNPQVRLGLLEGVTLAKLFPVTGGPESLRQAREAKIVQWSGSLLPDRCYNRNLSLHTAYDVEITPPLTWDPEWRPAPRIVSIHADEMGCGEYRISAPMRALQTAGRVMGWDVGHYFTPADWLRIDPQTIVFQRQITAGQIENMEFISRFSRAFRVFELDDLITNIPVQSSQKALFVKEKNLVKRFRKAVALCHRFVVSTDYLAESFRNFCPDIRVVPNYLDATRWLGFTPKRRVGSRLRVGWAGSITHAGDLRVIEQVVKDTASEVDWIFLGMCPESIRPYVREFHEPVPLAEYPTKLASLNLDLAVAPLEDVPFNHGKSHLRLLEYGIMGYPVICSDITPYRGDYPVWRVPNRYRNWVETLRELIAEPDALAEAGDTLRDYVRRRWLLQDHLDVWLSAWLP